MKYFAAFLTVLLYSLTMSAQDLPAYKLFTSSGKEVKWSKMVKDLQKSDMVFFGELHNNPISHWLEYELLKSLYQARDSSLVIGAEMFESDNQHGLDQYISGSYDESRFSDEVRLWKNYSTDYKPLVEFAKENNLKFVATNVPRKYASAVFKGDFAALDSLPESELRWIAPLPIPFDITVSCYQEMLKMGEAHPQMKIDEKYPKAQALKDATMAHFIIKNKIPGGIFYHINGSYHSDNFEGILWYVLKHDPALSIKTLSTVEQDDIRKPEKEHLGKASYLLVVPSGMTKTY